MRLVSRNRHVFDNPVQQQYELYRNGTVIGTAKYRISGSTMTFLLCETRRRCPAAEREAFYLTALRDARHRRLAVEITSRSMLEALAPLPPAAKSSGDPWLTRRTASGLAAVQRALGPAHSPA